MKACWCDADLLPSYCVLDFSDKSEDCLYVRDGEVNDKHDCEHWNESLAIDLCKEILGDGYAIHERLADIPNPCTYTLDDTKVFIEGRN